MGNNSASDIIEIGIVLSVISVVLLAVVLTLSTGKQLNEVVAETGRKTELAREAKRLSYFDNTEVYGNDIALLLTRDKGKFIVEVEEQLGITLGIMELDKEVVNTPNKIIEFLNSRD